MSHRSCALTGRRLLTVVAGIASLSLGTAACSSDGTPGAATSSGAAASSAAASTGTAPTAAATPSTAAATPSTTDTSPSAAAPTASASPGGGSTVIRAVASIDAWGSILKQLGGVHVQTTSIISSPDIDPHDYEPTTADGITIAKAQLVVENGVGYDSWAAKSVAANPATGREVINVGELVGVPDGGNPHQWYSHAAVFEVIDAITTDLQRLDPAHAAYFATQKTQLETVGFKQYNDLEQQIAAHDKGTAVGASESIASPLVDSLGLTMKTPYSFLKAISEGTDPAPRDIADIDSQISDKQIKVYLDNIQNSTPDVAAQAEAAKAAGIPVVALTETLSPKGASFQDWQVAQLTALQTALGAGGQ